MGGSTDRWTAATSGFAWGMALDILLGRVSGAVLFKPFRLASFDIGTFANTVILTLSVAQDMTIVKPDLPHPADSGHVRQTP